MFQLLIIQLFINLRISSHKCSIDMLVKVKSVKLKSGPQDAQLLFTIPWL